MRDFKAYIFIASLILVIYLVAQYQQPQPIDWTPSYLKEAKIPLGSKILYDRLPDIFPGAKVKNYREPMYNVLHDHKVTNATYIIISNYAAITTPDFDKMIPFIKQGNDVFISSTSFGDTLSNKFKLETNINYEVREQPDTLHFTNSGLDPHKEYIIEKDLRGEYFSAFDTAKAISLVQNARNQSTVLKFNMGKGALYLSTDPNLFTNYSLLKPDGAEFAAKALSYLKNNKTIIWDEYYNIGRDGEESEFRVLFAKEPLRWAYFISLISVIVYVLYQMKRRQRIIPVITPLENSTLGFVTVVGQVYYERRDNSNIAQKKVAYLLEYIRQKYRLQTNKIDQEFTATLASRADMDIEETREMVGIINYILSQAPISDQELIKANHLIEQFYTRSR
ncbi:DUF4350 domain-containing protein [Mucilaginibacter endophyticus]|uniref:DUF4350 domain-containing protein n=1 Tax=Mucilaginibacter endophyticus TaxID=2675003 RepID=UPI000E0CC21D|nr:DUF4350 domain-containing protein [Mucilaginibacter endophyticus]